jgi:DNA-binding NarL/FixJ family response regulator
MIRVLVVDDHCFLREALMDFLASTDDIVVVAECADGSEVVATAQRAHPDVVLMDVEMPQVDGLEASRALLEIQPDARILMLTGTVSAARMREAHSLGVKGYLLKGEDPSGLAERVREIAAGGTAWSTACSTSAAASLSALL